MCFAPCKLLALEGPGQREQAHKRIRRNPVFILQVHFQRNKDPLPIQTIRIGSITVQKPMKGFVCRRFYDTNGRKLYTIDEVADDVRAITFEDDVVVEVCHKLQYADVKSSIYGPILCCLGSISWELCLSCSTAQSSRLPATVLCWCLQKAADLHCLEL